MQGKQSIDIVFPDGFYVKELEGGTISIGIKCLEFFNFTNKHRTENGWCNLYIQKSKSGKLFAKWNDSAWRASTGTIDEPLNSDEGEEVIPF